MVPVRFHICPLGVPSGDRRTVNGVKIDGLPLPVLRPAWSADSRGAVGTITSVSIMPGDGIIGPPFWVVGDGNMAVPLDELEEDIPADRWWPAAEFTQPTTSEQASGLLLAGRLSAVMLTHELRNWPDCRVEALEP